MGNPLCHFEFLSNDTEKCEAFYSKVFDWEFKTPPGHEDYTLIDTGTEPETRLLSRSQGSGRAPGEASSAARRYGVREPTEKDVLPLGAQRRDLSHLPTQVPNSMSIHEGSRKQPRRIREFLEAGGEPPSKGDRLPGRKDLK